MAQDNLQLLSYSLTDKGLIRKGNEDCFLSSPITGLWLIADGMGGHEAGEVASAITKNTINEQVCAGKTLENSIYKAHKAVIAAVKIAPQTKGMGSTVVALSTKNEEYQVSWVGDSRAYLWTATRDGGQLEQLTVDHSFVQALLDSGSITPEEVDNHPDKNIITQCIGLKDSNNIEVSTVFGQWSEGQWILLCSDGLTSELDNPSIAQILCDAISPESATKELLQESLKKGARDNVTIQVIQSPVFFPPQPIRKNRILPMVTQHLWLDNLLYGMTFISLITIGIWILKGQQ
jgi:serine/threonine protein phosphatase PrpC